MRGTNNKLGVLFHRLGPYHHARLSALSEKCALTAIEFSSVDNTYAWDIVKNDNNYPVITLFNDADIDDKSSGVVAQKMGKALQEAKMGVVAIAGWSAPASLAALVWCCANNTPAILMSDSTAHDESRTAWKEWVKSRVVRLFSSAIVGGVPHVDYVLSLGLPRDKVFTSYGVVDNNYFQRYADAAREGAVVLRARHGLPERYFLACNRFIEKKNLPRLLDAYAAYVKQAGDGAWDMVMLGDGPLKPAIVDHVARLRLDKRVHLPGFKQYDELPLYYGLASAFVQPSTSEQWGLVVNEAMASGLPVLVSNRCGCAPDLVKDGSNGYAFDPYDVEEMTALMLHMGNGECDLAAMGQVSRKIIQTKSPQTFADNMMKAAEAALAEPRCRIGWFDRALLWLLMRR